MHRSMTQAIRATLTAVLALGLQWAAVTSVQASTAGAQKTSSAAKKPAAAQKKKAAAPVKVAQKRKKATLAKNTVKAKRQGVQVARKAQRPASVVRVASHSVGRQLGLTQLEDPLNLNSSVALVVDQETNEVLFSKNDSAVLPIASLTKLMTGLVVAEAQLPLDEKITITQDDVDTYKGSRSRLAVGTELTRGELMHLALMSSENRAAHALGRTHPEGMDGFVRLMNAKAQLLGMTDTRYVEPTGLSSRNRSSAKDLAVLVGKAYESPLLRDLSTSPGAYVDLGRKTLHFNNSNRLVSHPEWDIGLQKTGYISEAGRCLVMQASVAGRKLIMVLLDATGKAARIGDAERLRRWVENRAGDLSAPLALQPQG